MLWEPSTQAKYTARTHHLAARITMDMEHLNALRSMFALRL